MSDSRIIKAKHIDYSNYNKVVFVDASGDDGFIFDDENGRNSSKLFLVSAFMTTPNNIEHNNHVLDTIKDELNLDHSKELKSTTLKRHRFASLAYDHFSELRGIAFSEIAFKEKMLNYKDTSYFELVENEKKQLSGLIHSFPFYALQKLQLLNPNDKVLIVFDNMKTIEEKSVLKELEEFNAFGIEYNVVFADSKDPRFTLIQIADAICGTVRDFFETESFSKAFKICNMCKLRMQKCFKSPSGKKRLKKVQLEQKHSIVLNLHSPNEDSRFSINHMFTVPTKVYSNYYFLHCISNKKRS